MGLNARSTVQDIMRAVVNTVTNKLKVETDLQISSVTATDVTIKDAITPENKMKVNADGSLLAELAGSIGTLITAPITRVVTLTETPVALNSKSNLRQITVRNIDAVLRGKIGETGMTPANGKGLALEPGAVYQEDFDPTVPVTVYGRSEGASMQVEVYEK